MSTLGCMGFAPFDTGLIAQHLREQVSALHAVGSAADYAAIQELTSFRTPSAYVVFAEEKNTGKFPVQPQVCFQSASVEFGVVLALRHYREQLGEQMQQEARQLVGAVRQALIGHKPAMRGAGPVAWLSGRVLAYDAGTLLFGDMYQLHHTLHRQEPGQGGAR